MYCFSQSSKADDNFLDIALCTEFDSPQMASDRLNKALIDIQNWADKWLLKIAPSKTNSRHVRTRKMTTNN